MLKECDTYLEDYLLKNPASELLDLIYTYNMTLKANEFKVKIKNKIEVIFKESIEKYIFMKLKFSELQRLLKERSLRRKNEYSIIKALTLWFQYDPDNRMQYAKELFSFVNIHLCYDTIDLSNININTGNNNLDNIIKHIYIQISLKNHINNDLDLLNITNDYDNIIELSNIKYNRCTLYKVCEEGIYDVKTNNLLIKHDFKYISKVIYTKSKDLYILCCSISKMYKYNKLNNIISECKYPQDYLFIEHPPTINEMRNGNLISIGGYSISESTAIDTVMIYDINSNDWLEGPTLPKEMSEHTTIIDNNDIIYVFGGFTNTFVKNLLRYKNGIWEEMKSMNYNKRNHIALQYDNCIYALSGDDNTEDDPKISQYYNIVTDKWCDIDSDVFDDINANNCVYDANECLLYVYDYNDISCISMDNFTESIRFPNIEYIDIPVNKLVLM